MSQIVPILLIGLGGFLIGGVSRWEQVGSPAVLLALFSAACILGGVLWLMGM